MSEKNGNDDIFPLHDGIRLPPSSRRSPADPRSLADLLAEALAAYRATENPENIETEGNATQITDVIPMLSGSSVEDRPKLLPHEQPSLFGDTDSDFPNSADSLATLFGARPEADGTVPVRGIDLDWIPGREDTNWMVNLLSNVIDCGGQEHNDSVVMYGNIRERLLPKGILGVTAVRTELERRKPRTEITLYGLNNSSTLLYKTCMTATTNQEATYSTQVSRYGGQPNDIDLPPVRPPVLRSSSIGQLFMGYFCVTELYNRDRIASQEVLAPNYALTCYQRWRLLKSLGMPVLPPPPSPIPL